jgi:myo-inositol-1(or 4)-monophosphatase
LRANDAGDRAALALRLATAVREAGALALAMFGTPVKTWTKDQGSPVSAADIAVDDLLRTRLAATPGIAWLSEESADDPARGAARLVWVVDPIDGTRAYLAGRPDWSVAAALVEDGRPVAAAIFAPVEPSFYLAVAGQGATLDGAPIAASAGEGLDGARVAGPKPSLERLAARGLRIEAVPRIHSIALRFARVAHGMLDAAFSGGASHDWDLAAADLLVHEAGGALTTLAGRQLVYNRAEPVHGALVAAGRARHARLVELARTSGEPA